MTRGIFISYKRGADSADARTLYDPLKEAFGADRVHMDIDTFPIGQDFVAYIRREMTQCRVTLVVVGQGFHDRVAELDDQTDFMRLELEMALTDPAMTVVPIMFDGVGMPAKDALPPILQNLVFRSGQIVDHVNSGVIIRHGLIPKLEQVFDAPLPDPKQSRTVIEDWNTEAEDLAQPSGTSPEGIAGVTETRNEVDAKRRGFEVETGAVQIGGGELRTEVDEHAESLARVTEDLVKAWSDVRNGVKWLERSAGDRASYRAAFVGFGPVLLLVATLLLAGLLVTGQIDRLRDMLFPVPLAEQPLPALAEISDEQAFLAHLDAKLDAMVGDECRTQTGYPINPNSPDDMSVVDFNAIYGPKGSVKTFIGEVLEPYIDHYSYSIGWKPPLSLSHSLLDGLGAINLFADQVYSGNSGPNFAFHTEIEKIAPTLQRATLIIGKDSNTYLSARRRSTPFTMTFRSDLDPSARVEFEVSDGTVEAIEKQGPWAALRLFQEFKVKEVRSRIPDYVYWDAISASGQEVSIFTRTSSHYGLTAFGFPSFSGFSCPDLIVGGSGGKI